MAPKMCQGSCKLYYDRPYWLPQLLFWGGQFDFCTHIDASDGIDHDLDTELELLTMMNESFSFCRIIVDIIIKANFA